jgi:cytochrome c oxidase subunit 2
MTIQFEAKDTATMDPKRIRTWLAACFAALAAPAAFANPERWQLNMSPGVTASSQAAYEMHMIMLWICVAIGVVVFGAMGYALVKFRKSKGAVPDTSFTHSTKIEVIWTTIPVLILVVMAWPATTRLLALADSRDYEMTVKITGYQWRWRYEILDYRGQPQNINFVSSLDFNSNRTRMLGSGLDPRDVQQDGVNTYLLDVDRPLVLPTNTKVRFLITADDVIHAWWVPALGWKQDAIPGFINTAWTDIRVPGVYRGQCAELCGKDHGFMPIVVRAVPRAEFEQWLADNGGTLPAGDFLAEAATAPEATRGVL